MTHAYLKLLTSVQIGDHETVAQLLHLCDPRTDNSKALWIAARHGHTKCVELLIPYSDPMANGSAALKWAAEKGFVECVQLLIPVSNPMSNNSYALRMAVKNGHTACCKLLYAVSDTQVAFDVLRQHYPTQMERWDNQACLAQRSALQQIAEIDKARAPTRKM